MKYNYRIFFKRKNDASRAKSCKNIEIQATDFNTACKMGNNIANSENLRLVMVAELPK